MSEDAARPLPFFVSPETYQKPLDVVGVAITVLASNEATKGYEVTLQEGPAGAGPRKLHAHPWDESFFVLRGRVVIEYEGQRVDAGAGTFVHVPANRQHGFHFGEGGGAMLEMTGAGSMATRAFQLIASGVDVSPSAKTPK